MVVYKCERCGKKFSLKGDYVKHLNRKYPCIKNIDLNDKLDNLIQANKQMADKIDRMEKDFKVIRNKDTKHGGVSNNTHNGDMINIDNSTNVNNNIQVNVIAFGKEDTSFLTQKQRDRLVLQGLKSIKGYVELVHCNEDKPEYRNICVTNRKNMNGSILVYNGKKWMLCDQNYIDDLRDRGIEFIEDEYENFKNRNDVPKGVRAMAKRFIDHMADDIDGTKKSKMSEEIKIVLYNNRPPKEKLVDKQQKN